MNNCFNKVFSSFDPLNPEFFSKCRIIDIFSDHFSFHLFSKHNLKVQIQQLNNLAIESSSILFCTLIIIDTSIKNNITTSISHSHIHNKPIIKTLYHMVNITSTKAKIFTIRCSINQATKSNDISKIIVVTDSIYTTKRIFNSLSHLF